MHSPVDFSRAPAPTTVALALLVITMGCKSAPRGEPFRPDFPSKEELTSIEEREAPPLEFTGTQTVVERWRLADPLPDTLGLRAREPGDPWEKMLAERLEAVGGEAVPSTAMHCVAHQVGEFWLVHQTRPTESLEQYIRARCGSVATWSNTGIYTIGIGDDEAQESVLARLQQKDLLTDFEEAMARDDVSLGIWSGRRDGQQVIVVAKGIRKIDLEPMPLERGSGEVVFTGKVRDTATSINAIETIGDFGFQRCVTDPDIELPRFRIRCSPSPRDEQTVVDISVGRPGRSISTTILSPIVWSSLELSRTYRAPETSRMTREAALASGASIPEADRETPAEASTPDAGETDDAPGDAPGVDGDGAGEVEDEPTSAPDDAGAPGAGDARAATADAKPRESAADDGGEGADTKDSDEAKMSQMPRLDTSSMSPAQRRAAFVRLINEIRRRIDLEEVQNAEKQGETNSAMAAHFFASLEGKERDPALEDRILRGLMAGWDVDGKIVDGNFYSSHHPSGDLVGLLASMLESPGARSVLLAGESDRMAVGFAAGESSSHLGAVVTTYTMLDDKSPLLRAGRAVRQINDARKRAGRKKARRLSGLRGDADGYAEDIERGDLDPRVALEKLASDAAGLRKGRVGGYITYVSDLDDFAVPEEFVARKNLEMVVSAAPFRPKGSPWYYYALIVVFIQ